MPKLKPIYQRQVIIYKIKCLMTEDFYIGSSLRASLDRLKEHTSELRAGVKSSSLWRRLFEQFGLESFVIGELDRCSQAERYQREELWIARLQPTLNASQRAGGPPEHSPESKAKISDVAKDWWATHSQTPAQRAASDLAAQRMLAASPANKPGWVPAHRIGMKDTEETKARRSASKRATHEARRAQGLQHIWITDGVQECQILNTLPIPPGWYQGRQPKIGEVSRSRVGETRTEDARQHMSTSARNAWSDPAKRQAMMKNRRPFCWITNGVVSRRLHDDEEMPEGFRFGRLKSTRVEETIE